MPIIEFLFISWPCCTQLVGSWFPDGGLNPHPQLWMRTVLTTGPQGITYHRILKEVDSLRLENLLRALSLTTDVFTYHEFINSCCIFQLSGCPEDMGEVLTGPDPRAEEGFLRSERESWGVLRWNQMTVRRTVLRGVMQSRFLAGSVIRISQWCSNSGVRKLRLREKVWGSCVECGAVTWTPPFNRIPVNCQVWGSLRSLGPGEHVLSRSVLSDSDPMDCSPPGSSVHGISQARILEWVAVSSSRGPSPPRDRTWVSCVSCITDRFFTTEPPGESPGSRVFPIMDQGYAVTPIENSRIWPRFSSSPKTFCPKMREDSRHGVSRAAIPGMAVREQYMGWRCWLSADSAVWCQGSWEPKLTWITMNTDHFRFLGSLRTRSNQTTCKNSCAFLSLPKAGACVLCKHSPCAVSR